jgi:hypothetical protein
MQLSNCLLLKKNSAPFKICLKFEETVSLYTYLNSCPDGSRGSQQSHAGGWLWLQRANLQFPDKNASWPLTFGDEPVALETGDSVQRSVLIQGRGRNVSFSLGFSYWGANPMAVVSGMMSGKLVDTRIQKCRIRLRSLKFAPIVIARCHNCKEVCS